MWQYNTKYLMHMNGYKYTDKYRGKNGEWVYVYDDKKHDNVRNAQNAREAAIKKSQSIHRENIARTAKIEREKQKIKNNPEQVLAEFKQIKKDQKYNLNTNENNKKIRQNAAQIEKEHKLKNVMRDAHL